MKGNYSRPIENFVIQGFEIKKLSELKPVHHNSINFHNGRYTEVH